MWIPLTISSDGKARNLHLRATPESRVSDLADALARHLGATAPPRLSTVRGPLSPNDYLESAGIRAGAIVEVIGNEVHTGGATRVVARRELRVVGGPDSGFIVPLPENGKLVIGRGLDCEVRLSGNAVSRRHAGLMLTPDSIELTDLESKNHTAVDGSEVTRTRLTPGMRIQIGDHRLMLIERTGPPPSRASVDSQFRLTRRQRFRNPPSAVTLSEPKPPEDSPRAPATISFAASTGLLGGLIAYFFFHSFMFLILSGVSFAVGLVGSGMTLLKHKRGRSKAQRDHTAAMASHRAELKAALQDERARRLADAADPAEVMSVAQIREERLWERTPADDDFVRVRIGMADLDSDLTVHHADGTRTHRTMLDVPLEVDLATTGTIGVRGPRTNAHALGRWLLTQTVIQSGPSDLRVAVLTRPGDRDAAMAWDWVRWLPHATVGGDSLAFVGADETTLASRIDALGTVVAQRLQAGARAFGQANPRRHHPQWVVVVDDLPEFESPALAEILSKGPDVGVAIIALGQLPQRCPVEVTFSDDAHATVRRTGHAELTGVLVDQISTAIAETVARELAPLQDPQLVTAAVGLPGQVSLLDLLSLSALDPASLIESWVRTPRQTKVVVGANAAGPLFVDMLAHGPHALVAGQTGSGKSAMLQTIVASLAAANRPDELGFILVDFKGDTVFQQFDGLPHLLGKITNLDGHAVMRALQSLEGELDRRQRYFARAGAVNKTSVGELANYHALADNGQLPPDCPTHLPRVYVVIDEFAMFKKDVPPEILEGLVRIATIGRTLGVHLVIGTQTPAGAVPGDMRPNVNLRVAFRLDATHSQDVINVPDAQHLAGSGRGYLKRGNDGELVLFQSAYVGGSTRNRLGAAVSVVEVPFARLGYLPAEEKAAGATDIDVLVSAIRDAAALAGTAQTPPPWLPDLPSVIPLAALPAIPAGGDLVLPYGQEDQPELRAQPTAAWNLTQGTHLLVAGKPRSGRTTLLRTLAASIATYPTDRVQLYVMDCGGALDDLANLPHCGALVTHHEIERGARLLDRLDGLLTAHENGTGHGSGSSPHTVLFIDGWEEWAQTFGEVDNGALMTQLTRLVRRGPAAGLHLAITGGTGLLTSSQTRPLTEAAQDRLALPFNPEDYRWLGLPATAVPAGAEAGQAVRLTAPHRTVRVAIVGRSPDPSAQAATLRALGASVTLGTRPWRVDALPRAIRLGEARLKPRDGKPLDHGVYLGVGGDDLHQLGIDFDVDGPGIYIAGPERSDRGNALLAIGADLLGRGIPVIAVAPSRGSALYALKDKALLVSNPGSRRVMQLALAAFEPPFVVLIDDALQLERSEADPVLKEMLTRHEQPWSGMVVAAGIEDLATTVGGSFLTELGRSGTGLILGPRTPRPQLFSAFVRIPPAYVAVGPDGRGVLVRRSGIEPIQVPIVTDTDLAELPALAAGLPELLERANTAAGTSPSSVDGLRAIVRDLRASAGR